MSPATEPTTAPEETAPTFSVVAGNPSDEDLAVLSVVVTALRRARGKPHAPTKATVAGGWKSYWHTIRQPVLPGREAWRSTFRR